MNAMHRNPARQAHPQRSMQGGQALIEYLIVCALVLSLLVGRPSLLEQLLQTVQQTHEVFVDAIVQP